MYDMLKKFAAYIEKSQVLLLIAKFPPYMEFQWGGVDFPMLN